MAKGDSTASQNQIDTQGNRAQTDLEQLWRQNTDRTTNFQNLYGYGTGSNLNDYNAIMSNYNSFLNPTANRYQTTQNTGASNPNFQPNQMTGDPRRDAVLSLYNKYGVTPGARGSGLTDLEYWAGDAMNNANGDMNYVLDRLEKDLQGNGPDAGGGGGDFAGNNWANTLLQALGGYSDFAKTGGFSDQDIQNLRARAIAPTRAIYANAQANVDRQRALGSGYAPNYAATQAKLARDEANAISDQNVNANASIAQLVQQGKLYGLAGMGGLGSTARGQNLGAMGQQTSLYGATPGLINTFGNQVLGSANQGVNLGGLQNQLALGIMNAQNQRAAIPGNFQSGMGNLASLFSLFGQGGGLGNILKNFPGLGGGGSNYGSMNNDGWLGSYDPYSGYGPMGYPTDPSGGTGVGPGMAWYYNNGGGDNVPNPLH